MFVHCDVLQNSLGYGRLFVLLLHVAEIAFKNIENAF